MGSSGVYKPGDSLAYYATRALEGVRVWPAISGICQHLQSPVTHIIRFDLPNNPLEHSEKFSAPLTEEKTGLEQLRWQPVIVAAGDGGTYVPAPDPPDCRALMPSSISCCLFMTHND